MSETTSITVDSTATASAQQISTADVFISLSPLSTEALAGTLANIVSAFGNQSVVVGSPDSASPEVLGELNTIRMVPYTPSVPSAGSWVLTAADYVNTYKLMQENNVATCLLLGPESQSLHPEALRGLAMMVASGTADLVTPRYDLRPRDGLVNSAILYPVTRALFGTRPRYPLAIDLAFSLRMAEKLAACGQRFTASGQNEALVWPVAEAAASGFTVSEVPAGTRTLPPPDVADLNSLLAQVAGSLFGDIDAKASVWQRSRLAYAPRGAASLADAAADTAGTDSPDLPDLQEVQPMLDSFRLAYTNLHEIWSLVLPPNSLLGLKKLSLLPPASFRMPDALWVRIVYDFMLAYRLRTINRGHLLGALTPLYLAWVASHLLLARGTGTPGETNAGPSMAPERHIETLAAAFETDKAYLVSRWRWPDRFNP